LQQINPAVQAKQVLHILPGRTSKASILLLCMQLLRSVGLDITQRFIALKLY